ncbi:hypothetical protein K438DRAFT_925049 [Mycena galopus ATCC 62051]|nr:hypothetical protein K438DRAFT_925049 [Mycena galopus ATCC 62051]
MCPVSIAVGPKASGVAGCFDTRSDAKDNLRNIARKTVGATESIQLAGPIFLPEMGRSRVRREIWVRGNSCSEFETPTDAHLASLWMRPQLERKLGSATSGVHRPMGWLKRFREQFQIQISEFLNVRRDTWGDLENLDKEPIWPHEPVSHSANLISVYKSHFHDPILPHSLHYFLGWQSSRLHSKEVLLITFLFSCPNKCLTSAVARTNGAIFAGANSASSVRFQFSIYLKPGYSS